MLSLVICRIFFGELFTSFIHFQIRFHFYCWVLSFYFQLQRLYHMNASWVFSSILWKVFSVFCYCSFKFRLTLNYPTTSITQVQAIMPSSKAVLFLCAHTCMHEHLPQNVCEVGGQLARVHPFFYHMGSRNRAVIFGSKFITYWAILVAPFSFLELYFTFHISESPS